MDTERYRNYIALGRALASEAGGRLLFLTVFGSVLYGTDIPGRSDEDVRGVYLCSYYFLPQMLAQHYGTIINMSSVSGLLGDTDMVAYNTAKGAITNMTRCMAIDYAKDGIRVNAICPGAVETEILLHTFHSVPGAEEKFNNAYPTGHVGTAVEIANACVFLASRECDFLNGVNLPIDGGITAHTGQPYMGNY